MKQHSTKSLLALDQIMTDTMREAAQQASIADGVLSVSQTINNNNNNNNSNNLSINEQNKLKKTDLRRGKWTNEEEAYANRLIDEFKAGMLPIADGTTLRTFLSKLLNCDPMRISKKYVGNNCIGKQVYRQRHGDLDDIPPERIERSRQELEELERQFIERSKQSNGRNRPTKNDSGPKIPKVRKENNNSDVNHQFKSNSMNANGIANNNNKSSNNNNKQNNNQVAPWIIPSSNYSSFNSESNPYNLSDNNIRNNNSNNNNNNNSDIHEYKTSGMNNSYGVPERAISDIDLYNLPDAFASSSSLDILGTIAEMKLPSARSLENLQKFGMEGNGASTASLSEWYTILGENASLSSSMVDLPSQNVSTTSLSSNFNTSMDWSTNPLMPWDTKKSISDNMNNESQSQLFVNNNNNNNSNNNNTNNDIGDSISQTMKNNINSNNNNNNNSILKHSLSKELLQAAAAAVAHDEAKQEIAKILKQQYTDKLKEFTLNNNLNTSLNTNSTDINQKNNIMISSPTPTSVSTSTSTSIPRSSNAMTSPYDTRRSASVNNFMMLVEMGDIPKPDPSVLLKNIFNDVNTNSKVKNQSNSFPIPTNKRSLDSKNTQQEYNNNIDNIDNNGNNDNENLNKKRRFVNSSDDGSDDNTNVNNSDNNDNNENDDDDCLGDEHIISATVVRRPFT